MLVKKEIASGTLIFGGGYEVRRLFRRCIKKGAYCIFLGEPAIGFHNDGCPRMYGIMLSEEDGRMTIDWLTAEDTALIAIGRE